MLRRLGLVLLIIGSQAIWAVTTFNRIWNVFTLNGTHGNYLYTVQPWVRLNEENLQLNQFLANAGIGYKLPDPWRFWFGYSYSKNAADTIGNDTEMRFWEQIDWRKENNNYSVFSRSRLEQRKSFSFKQIANRFRERITIQIPIKNKLSTVLFNELFFNINKVQWVDTTFWDQNRTYIGLEQQASSSFAIGIGYMYRYIFTSQPTANQIILLSGQLDIPS